MESHIDDKIMADGYALPRMVLLLKNDHLVRSFKTIHRINGWAENIVV